METNETKKTVLTPSEVEILFCLASVQVLDISQRIALLTKFCDLRENADQVLKQIGVRKG